MDGRLTSMRTCAVYRLDAGSAGRVSWESWWLPFLTELEGRWQYRPRVTKRSNAPARQRPSGKEEGEQRRFKSLATPTRFLRHTYRRPPDLFLFFYLCIYWIELLPVTNNHTKTDKIKIKELSVTNLKGWGFFKTMLSNFSRRNTDMKYF